MLKEAVQKNPEIRNIHLIMVPFVGVLCVYNSLIHTCRCIFHSLHPVSCDLWRSSVHTGDSTGPVHKSGRNNVLEEGLPFDGR